MKTNIENVIAYITLKNARRSVSYALDELRSLNNNEPHPAIELLRKAYFMIEPNPSSIGFPKEDDEIQGDNPC